MLFSPRRKRSNLEGKIFHKGIICLDFHHYDYYILIQTISIIIRNDRFMAGEYYDYYYYYENRSNSVIRKKKNRIPQCLHTRKSAHLKKKTFFLVFFLLISQLYLYSQDILCYSVVFSNACVNLCVRIINRFSTWCVGLIYCFFWKSTEQNHRVFGMIFKLFVFGGFKSARIFQTAV